MTEPIRNLEATIERLEAAAADAREATREAHEATKLARAAKRELEDLRTAIAAEIDEQFKTRIEGVVETKLAEYTQTIKDAQEAAVARVFKTFDHLADIMTGEDEGGFAFMIEQRKRAAAAKLHGLPDLRR